jgi:hypothetical protein
MSAPMIVTPWIERWEREFASRWEPVEDGRGLEPSIDVEFPSSLQVVVELQIAVEAEAKRQKEFPPR